jgi:hypothetical protein
MTKSDAALDLHASQLPAMAGFAALVERQTFARLIALAVRLDRSAANARALRDGVCGNAGLDSIDNQLACMFGLVEAEMERRLAGPLMKIA